MPLFSDSDTIWGLLRDGGPVLAVVLDAVLICVFVPWVLLDKKDPIAAIAWSLLVIVLPFFGALFFLLFGYQRIQRRLRRRRAHRAAHPRSTGPAPHHPPAPAAPAGAEATAAERPGGTPADRLHRLARRFGGFPPRTGNAVDFYHEGAPAYAAMLSAIRSARRHVHLGTYIFEPDAAGDEFLRALSERAAAGVQVRLLYDAVGALYLSPWRLKPLRDAGGKTAPFMPVWMPKRFQVNLRNHRKILVVDGRVAFTGGLNIGREYLGEDPKYGYWRDTHLRVEGGAVGDLQRIFLEDWDFASGEKLITAEGDSQNLAYFPVPEEVGGTQTVQVIDSGPDQDLKGIRELYFAAACGAARRLWIASPYFVPDPGLLDALRLAGFRGVDVRFLSLSRPDKAVPFYAARYYWPALLEAGVKVYLYEKGIMHAKVMIVDGQYATAGTANFDNRSLRLNFEVNCLFSSPESVRELERQFERDLEHSTLLDAETYSRRPATERFLEQACRLLSPVL